MRLIYARSSPFYEELDLANLHAKLVYNTQSVVLGDMNARFGNKVIIHDPSNIPITYENKPDTGVNINGNRLVEICRNTNVAIVNNSSYKGREIVAPLTYRQGRTWKSELDLVLIDISLRSHIERFDVCTNALGSDHAPISFSLVMERIRPYKSNDLLDRAKCLGVTIHERDEASNPISKSLNYDHVCTSTFFDILSETDPPVIPYEAPDRFDDTIKQAECVIMQIAKNCKKEQKPQVKQGTNYWQKVLSSGDNKSMWQAIDWNGKFNPNPAKSVPSDDALKRHFESLLNDNDVSIINNDVTLEPPYIPALDDPFELREVETAVRSLKPNKGYIGIAPGLIKCLPSMWLLFILGIFNIIFKSCSYPVQWSISKLFTIFKSGDSLSCGNYRGISVPNTLAKLYDMMIHERLYRWCTFDKSQAGGQPGRGCIEQIMTLRLAIDYAAQFNSKLYVLFIDFSKAYDRVNRRKMVDVLKSLGCGRTMLLAIITLYKSTQFVLKSAIFIANQGVRQGASTSITLFILYMDRMVRLIKSVVERDGFLGTLHALVLMDDTVILSCSRDVCIKKMTKVFEFCSEFGMDVNISKTSFFVINGNTHDREPLIFDQLRIPYKAMYCYLGSYFTDDGKISSSLKLHMKKKTADINKFIIFCTVNTTIPFYLKKQVFESCLLSSVLYGCETWLTTNLKEIERVYIRMVKVLLGVRASTPSVNCLLELGLENLSTIVNERRRSFLQRKFKNTDMDEPFHIMMEICKNIKSKSFNIIERCINNYENSSNISPRDICLNKPDTCTKFVLYRSIMNSDLSVHPVYRKGCLVPDFQRVVFTRLRLTSHSLISEKGRWSRTPADMRVCPCDRTSVQNEFHALLRCPWTAEVRREYKDKLNIKYDLTINELMKNRDLTSLCDFIYRCIKIFDAL